DIQLPGTLHVAVVRSPYGHATITGIDASAALALPGVVAVFTGKDLKAFCGPLAGGGGEGSTSGEGSSGEQGDPDAGADADIPTPSTWAVAVDRVRFVGEPVAVVVAEDRYRAEDGREAVVVDYDALPTVARLEDARADGAQLLYDEIPNNQGMRWDRVHGDVEAAFRDAPVTASARIRSQRLAGVPMEPRGILAAPDPITRGLTVWTSTQAPHWNRNDIAKALGLSQTQVRAIAPEVGGGFGVKIGSYQEDFICAALAHRLGRPVKWIETRSENFLATHHGRDQWADVEVAADADGRLRGVRMNVVQDLGAYAKGTDLPELTGRLSAGCYDIPALEFHATGYYTNTMAVGAYRGAGRPEAAYYIERAIDLVADAGGLDPAEVRRVNFIPPDQFPHTTAAGEIYDTGEYEKALDKALEISGYADLRREQAEGRAQGRYLGIGLASYVEICGFGPYESSTVRVEPSGAVSIFTGISPHGQGQETTFAQLAADHIGADFDQVFVHHGDTSNTPQGNGTMGSRGLAVGGGALMLSLTKVQDKARRVAAHLLEAAVEDIELHEGKYRVRGVPEGGMSLAQVAEAVYDDIDDLPRDIEAGLQSTDYFRPEDETFPFGTHVALVEVSAETGEVEILRYISVDDCGVIVSPLLVTGQVHGGLAQGIGQALFEEIRYDATGELVTGTLNDYTIARARYLPRFETHHTETPTPINLIGAKGIGEAATIGSTPAIANAVIDALEPFGITHLDVPMTPERVWQAIRSSGAAPAVTGRAAD
ncbi:MAG: xanthine dehydrogenase family protein molybdopterin-binding subunit, partial [Chloroflexota bacterium]|nr:xanthine dehydrogenase family protein molybdopterin-binding subunit [Chloroflexota bacterium]